MKKPVTLNVSSEFNGFDVSLRTKIKLYKMKALEIERYLAEKPNEWAKFQHEFNSEVNLIFRDIMNFERDNLGIGCEEKVHKLKQIFINRIRGVFLKGTYNQWSLSKPFGYTGDFKIIDDIYQNNPLSTGFERLFDNYFQMSAISVAVRNRKDDFKRLIVKIAQEKIGKKVRIMSLAAGSCRDIKELLSSDPLLYKNTVFDCYDHETKAIEFAKNILDGFSNVTFHQENALRIAAARNINSIIKEKYDFIFSTGLFDYFNHKISVRLIANLKKLLNEGGSIAVSSVRDKYSNPSVHYMEWVGDWVLIYRNDEEFKKIFVCADFNPEQLRIQYEQQGIMQYIIASLRETQPEFKLP